MPRSTAVSIDHSDGHAFLDKGTIYYSPNSSQAVSVPPYEPQRQRYPFHHDIVQKYVGTMLRYLVLLYLSETFLIWLTCHSVTTLVDVRYLTMAYRVFYHDLLITKLHHIDYEIMLMAYIV
jgi:hypothetical protein